MTHDLFRVASRIVAVILLALVASLVEAQDRKEKRSAADFNMACELYLAEGQGHGFVNIEPWNYVSSKYAADFFMRAGILEKAALPEVPAGELKKYHGEPIEKVYVKTQGNPTRMLLKNRGGKTMAEEPVPVKQQSQGPR